MRLTGYSKMVNKKLKQEREKSEELFVSGHHACAGCGPAIAMRQIIKTAGKDSIVTIGTGCMEVISTLYPFSSWKVPCIHSAFENTAATASGIEAALKKQGKKTNVIAIAGDGGTFDIGLQALSGAIERGHKFLFVCYDNGAYMNTGVQRSSATPLYARTTTTPAGKKEEKKHMPFIVASHGKVYVATANIAYPVDLQNKIRKALAFNGPSYIQIFSPCVPGWNYHSSETVQIARLAVETRASLLYEIENGIVKLNKEIENPKALKLWLERQGRFKSLSQEESEKLQNYATDYYKHIKKLSDSGIKLF